MSLIHNHFNTKIKYFCQYGWFQISDPVFIYQMGKVASSSIYKSLRKTKNVNIFHAHYLHPENIFRLQREFVKAGGAAPNLYDSIYLYKRFFKDKKKAVKIISLVREPISRNISAFFQNLNYFRKLNSSYDFTDLDQMISCFLDIYNHDVPLIWFATEFKSTTGIDIYKYPFPHDKGYIIIKSYPYEVLVLRHDLNDIDKEDCIVNFLGIESLKIKRVNDAASKAYSDSYMHFKDSIKLPENYIQKMLSSQYSKHFYSPKELDEINSQWSNSEFSKKTINSF